MTGGNREGGAGLARVDANSCFRLSSFGRNRSGVWRTDGAEEGGLKMIWSCCGELFERKDGSGLTFRRCFARLAEDSCRRAVRLRESRHGLFPDMRSMTGRLTSLASIVEREMPKIRQALFFSSWSMFSNFGAAD